MKRRLQSKHGGPRKPFCEELMEPLYEPRLNQLQAHDPSFEVQREARIIEAWRRKLDLLFQHYDLAVGGGADWRALAYNLAIDLVEGFNVIEQPPPKAGRPRFATRNDNRALATDIEELALRKSITASQACTVLTKTRGSKWSGAGSSRALYARYLRYLRPQIPASRLAYLRNALEAQRASTGKSGSLGGLARLGQYLIEEPLRRILEKPNGTKTR